MRTIFIFVAGKRCFRQFLAFAGVADIADIAGVAEREFSTFPYFCEQKRRVLRSGKFLTYLNPRCSVSFAERHTSGVAEYKDDLKHPKKLPNFVRLEISCAFLQDGRPKIFCSSFCKERNFSRPPINILLKAKSGIALPDLKICF